MTKYRTINVLNTSVLSLALLLNHMYWEAQPVTSCRCIRVCSVWSECHFVAVVCVSGMCLGTLMLTCIRQIHWFNVLLGSVSCNCILPCKLRMAFHNLFLLTFILYCRFHKQNVAICGYVPQSVSNCLPTALSFLPPLAPSRRRWCCCSCCNSGSRSWRPLLMFKSFETYLNICFFFFPHTSSFDLILCKLWNFGGLLSCILNFKVQLVIPVV